MDDFPAGPACPGARGPSLSVVIPVKDGGHGFERCLQGLRASHMNGFELIVVDDGSRDGSGQTARNLGASVIRHESPLGPAAARNEGARAASGELVFFLDADVVPHPDTLTRALAHFHRQPGLAGLFGSYDDQPEAPGLASQYRNLLHHYVHQVGDFDHDARPAHTFWTGCGVIRRDVFLSVGGFDPELYRRPAIEDIELGYRLHRAGHPVVLARDVQVQHLKRWTLRSIVRTDLLHRGIPWMLLILRSQVAESDLNVSPAQRRSVALTGLALLGAFGSLVQPWLVALSAACLLGVAGLNRGFYRFLAARLGWPRAVAAFPLHLVYFGCCGLSVLVAVLWLALSRPGGSNRLPRRVDQGRPARSRRNPDPARSTASGAR
jgi:glycosyltransferase involved in cell wall biosynthesis